MKRWWMLALLCGSVFGADTAHRLTGRVVDAQTGAPIARARVRVLAFTSPAEQVLLLTDESGTFEVRNLPEGNYQLSCGRTGYLENGGTSLNITANSKDQPVTLRLAPQAVIEGTVVDENGVAMPFANVQVFRRAVVNGRWTAQVGSGNPADDKGGFRFFGLAAGTYYVGVTLSSEVMRLAKGVYPPTFYPGSRTADGAQIIELRPGQEEQIRMRLPAPLPSREIRGQLAPSGPSVNFQLHPAGGAPSPLQTGFNFEWDQKTGRFRIFGIASGEYVLEAFTQIGEQQRTASTRLVVGDRDITGVRLEPRERPVLHGTVRMEGQTTPARLIGGIELHSASSSQGAQADADGRFRFDGLSPGAYHVRVPASPGYVRSVWQGNRDALREGVLISADTAPEPIELVLGAQGGTIEGSIALPVAGRPENLRVVLLRRAGNEVALEKEMSVSSAGPVSGVVINEGCCAQSFFTGGHFTIEGVAPGDYLLYAWPSEMDVAYAEPDFLRRYESAGKTVTVSEGAKVTASVDRVLGGK